jgi:hypothetical protein
MSLQLSERAKQLILKARIVSFQTWQPFYSPEILAIFQQADDEGRYLTDEDITKIITLAPQTESSLEKAKFLRDNVSAIVAQSRARVLEQFPSITEPGGDLYPPERAEACWRDFWHFLRCITYGIAGEKIPFISQDGLDNMQLLYDELRVPLKAMVVGLENLKFFSLQTFDSSEQTLLSPYFEHLIQQMKSFLND